jgi:hypothetical protein
LVGLVWMFRVVPLGYVVLGGVGVGLAALDDKNSWGTVAGTSFPRSPLVAAGELRGLPDEGGTYLGKPGLLAAGPNDERFLELGGWKDANQAHEPGVTSTSTNEYADRGDIVQKYTGALEPSRFWYYAELYDSARFARLASSVQDINFTKIFTKLNDPALLCYYLFFPAHEESVGDGACPNVEAKEIGCHAGDWQCIALLLEGDGSGEPASFTPRFFGHTGVSATPVNGELRPLAFDDDHRTVMTVEEWRAGTASASIQPEVVGDHPRFYVARGTHSLYTAPGAHEVILYSDYLAPRQCGRFDTPKPFELSHAGQEALEDTSKLFLAKMVGGGLAFPPEGLLIGYVAAIVEAIIATSDDPEAPDDPSDVFNPDQAPTAGAGLTLRPAGLELPDAGDAPTDWRTREGLSANGRMYGFLVDRTTQAWWPSDDRQSGFLGRWGQRVTSDSLPRRCGPAFPDYWKMFLYALADGDARGLLTI